MITIYIFIRRIVLANLILFSITIIYNPDFLYAKENFSNPKNSKQKIDYFKSNLTVGKQYILKNNPEFSKNIIIGTWLGIYGRKIIIFNKLNKVIIKLISYDNKGNEKYKVVSVGKWKIINNDILLIFDKKPVMKFEVSYYKLYWNEKMNFYQMFIFFTDETDSKYGLGGLEIDFR